tara:strand:- start:615 stop:1004 length:390 start_codon:yes stop_codon:yes gene_type:complete
MVSSGKYLQNLLILCFSCVLIFLSGFMMLFADEINWVEVAKTNNQIQSIDVNSIKYNNEGFLSVLTKYSETNPADEVIINTNTYLMAIDCDNRLFSKLPVNTELKQVNKWNKPIDDKLIKTTIINSCFY